MGRMSFILIKNEEAGAGGSEENEMDSLYIIIPAYNEEENILRVLEDWYPVVERHSGEGRSRLVVVDDGSRDGTRRILEEYAAEHPLLVPLTKKNGGHGAARALRLPLRPAPRGGLYLSDGQRRTDAAGGI